MSEPNLSWCTPVLYLLNTGTLYEIVMDHISRNPPWARLTQNWSERVACASGAT